MLGFSKSILSFLFEPDYVSGFFFFAGKAVLYLFGRYPPPDFTGRHILGDHCASSYDASAADGCASHYDGITSYPNIVFDKDVISVAALPSPNILAGHICGVVVATNETDASGYKHVVAESAVCCDIAIGAKLHVLAELYVHLAETRAFHHTHKSFVFNPREADVELIPRTQ